MVGLGSACSGGGGSGGGGGDGDGGAGGTGNGLAYNPVVIATNEHRNERTETLQASVPFPEGMTTGLDDFGVSGIPTAWRPLQYWSDGSIRVAQAQFTDTLSPGETKRYDVVEDVVPLTGAFQQNDWVARFGGNLAFGARVTDRFDVPYTARTAGDGREIYQTRLIRVTHHRLYHENQSGAGIGRDFLTSQFYVMQYRDVPVVTVDWIVGNDYLGADDPNSTDPNLFPLGGIDVNSAAFRVQGHTDVQPYKPQWHAVGTPTDDSGWSSFEVMTDTYFDDGQTRRYRFHVLIEDPGAPASERDLWRATFAAMCEENMIPLAGTRTWQATDALNMLGGPATGPSNATDLARGEYDGWSDLDVFGTWGRFDDVQYSGTSGSPRNGPMSGEVAHAIQAEFPRLLIKLEQKAWAQAQRPYHLYGLYVGAEQDILLWDPIPVRPGTRDLSDESLGRRNLWDGSDPYAAYRSRVDFRAHGWNGYDHEHFTMDLLFDYWTVTGDAWAHEEIRQLGESCKGLMRLHNYATSNIKRIRAEGWTMRGYVHAYLATQDDAMKSYAMRRIREVVDSQRWREHASGALKIDRYDPRVGVPPDTDYFSAWEYGPFLMGYLGAAKHFDDPLALDLAELGFTVVEWAWVTDYTHPRSGAYVENALRYACPLQQNGVHVAADFVDNDPNWGATVGPPGLGGTAKFCLAGINAMAVLSDDTGIRARARQKGDLMLAQTNTWDHWASVAPQTYEPDDGGGN